MSSNAKIGSMSVYPGWTLSAEQVVELPVDELGLRILADVAATSDSHPNRHNWLNHFLNSGIYGRGTSAAIRALSEGWQWLYSRGLVAADPSQSSGDWVFITRLGYRVLQEGLEPLEALDRLNVDLHPRLEHLVRRQFLMGEYELAAFAAMREIEIRVRELAGAPDSDLGVALMRRAFGEGGPLRDDRADGGEQRATMDLFAGAIGVFKNPSSHREVEFDDPTHAAEVILFADLLMRILDSRQADRAD